MMMFNHPQAANIDPAKHAATGAHVIAVYGPYRPEGENRLWFEEIERWEVDENGEDVGILYSGERAPDACPKSGCGPFIGYEVGYGALGASPERSKDRHARARQQGRA